MGRLRYIEPEFWENPALRRLGFVSRLVFAYIFSRHADDEGRFDWEPVSVLDGAFSRADPVSLEDVERAMQAMVEEGMLLPYGAKFGFVVSWYAHQRMYGNLRRHSTRPRPPVEVGAWAEADSVLSAYAEHLKVGLASDKKLDPKKVSYKEAMRWYLGLSDRQRKAALGAPKPRRTRSGATVQSLHSNSTVAAASLDGPLSQEGVVVVEGEVEGESENALLLTTHLGAPQPPSPEDNPPPETTNPLEAFRQELGNQLRPTDAAGIKLFGSTTGPEEAADYRARWLALLDRFGEPRLVALVAEEDLAMRTDAKGRAKSAPRTLMGHLERIEKRVEASDQTNGPAARLAGGNGPEAAPKKCDSPDWPADPRAVRETDTEIIRRVARSPDWDDFPPLATNFRGEVLDPLQRERNLYLKEVRLGES